MKTDWILVLIMVACIVIAGCSSHILLPRPYSTDSNSPIMADGGAANILATQLAANMANEAARLSDLFKYNSLLFLILFVVMLGGAAFAIITKSSLGYVIPTIAGAGLAILIFITQSVKYINYIVLGVVVIALGVLVYKCYNYQSERNKLAAALAAKDVK